MESTNQQRGIQLFELGRYAEALKFLRASLNENPEDGTGKYFIALCLLNIGQFTEAEKIIDALQSENPDDASVFYLKSHAKFHLNKDKEALSLIDIAISMRPDDDDFFAMKSNILLSQKHYDEALSFANKALEIDAKHQHALNLRAQILTKLDRKEEASSTVENILQDNPEDDYSHANVGWVELENGNTKKALSHFKEALALNPNFEYARQGMSTALKGKNPIYALYLKYSFWISKKSSKNQWIFIIGVYLIYRFSVKLLSASGLTYLAVPLIILYLLFALGGWLMEPLSNAILNFDSYGKYLLNADQRNSGLSFGGLFLAGILFGISYYIFNEEYLLALAVTFCCLLLPFPRSFLLDSEKAKNLVRIYSFVLLVVGFVGPFLIGVWTSVIAVFVMTMLYTWIGNYIEEL